MIVVRGVDTVVSPFDAGSYAELGTYVTGLAAKNAATELREKICAKAAQMWDVDAADVVFDGQYVRLSDERAAREQNRYLTLRDFANLCVKNIAGGDALTSHASACLPVSPPPFMAGIAEVEVDKATGKVTVVDYAAAVDCGTVINEALARVQAEGGIAQGIGHALYEIVEHDDRGRLRTGNFMSYKLPTRLDIGAFAWPLSRATSRRVRLAASRSARSSSTRRSPPWPRPSHTPPATRFARCPSRPRKRCWGSSGSVNKS